MLIVANTVSHSPAVAHATNSLPYPIDLGRAYVCIGMGLLMGIGRDIQETI